MARNTKAAAVWRVVVVLVAALAVLLATLAAFRLRRPAAPAEPEVLEDEWLIVQLAGEPAGRGRTLVRRKGDRILMNSKVTISVSRLGAPITISVTQSFLETAGGTPIRLRMVQDMAVQKVKVTGRLEGGNLRLTSETMGQTRTKTVDWPDDVVVGYAMERHIRREIERLGGERGAKFTFKTFSLEHDDFLDVTYELEGEETIDVLGERVRAAKFEITGIAPGVTVTEYRDAEGVTWRQEMGIAGMEIALLRAAKDVAEEKTKTPARLDAIGQIAVVLDGRVARQFEVDSARYRIRLKDGRAAELSLDGPRQSVARTEQDGSVVLDVRAVRVDPASAPAFPIDAATVEREDLAGCLRPTTYLQSDDAALAAEARKVARGAKDSSEAAKLLERWVFANLTNKGFDRGFASAKEVFQDRAGDCTEHAVLLAAMLRAVGVPSRVATGVIYMELQPGEHRMFYHMWTEGWVGRWLPLDATLAGDFVDACHIRLACSDVTEMSPEAGSLEILQAIGRLRVEVLEYSVDGRKVVPARDAGPARVERGRVRVADYGASFALPGGWELDSRRGVALAAIRNRRDGARIQLDATATAPGEVAPLVRLAASRGYALQGDAKLGGLDGCMFARGRSNFVLAVRKGTAYELSLEPASPAGLQVLHAVAASFRVE